MDSDFDAKQDDLVQTSGRVALYVAIAFETLATRAYSAPIVEESLLLALVKGVVAESRVGTRSADVDWVRCGARLACALHARPLVDHEPELAPEQFDSYGFTYRQAVAWSAAMFVANRLDTKVSHNMLAGPLPEVEATLARLGRGELGETNAIVILTKLIHQFGAEIPSLPNGSQGSFDVPDPIGETSTVTHPLTAEPVDRSFGTARTWFDEFRNTYEQTPFAARMLILSLAFILGFLMGAALL
ncbi:hypothetical protein ACFV24_27120 [Nocardia fluminea]|uniref:hypothetical protein n=1 Tax=Nocardia fluminea TaxID=134984 RepID=UPI00366F7BB1